MSVSLISVKTSQDYFRPFEKQFPGVEERFEAARQLAGPDLLLPPSDYMICNTLAAHWGEETEQLFNIGRYLYSLASRTEKDFGKPVLVVKKGSVKDVLSENDTDDPYDSDGPYLTDDVEITYGILHSDELIYSFAGKLVTSDKLDERDPRITSKLILNPPYLRFGVHMTLFKPMNITLDVLGDGQAEAASRNSNIAVYEGVIPLRQPDPEEYSRAKTRLLPVFIGKPDCQRILSALVLKTREEKVMTVLSSLALAKAS